MNSSRFSRSHHIYNLSGYIKLFSKVIKFALFASALWFSIFCLSLQCKEENLIYCSKFLKIFKVSSYNLADIKLFSKVIEVALFASALRPLWFFQNQERSVASCRYCWIGFAMPNITIRSHIGPIIMFMYMVILET